MKVLLCGASSVGKSTLADRWCSSHREYYRIQEIARCIMKDKNISTQDLKASLSTEEKSVFLQLQCDIIDEQDRIESKMLDNPFISDRGPDPFIYIQTHCSKKALDDFTKRPSFISCMNRYRQGSLCIILCPLDFSTDDGVRLVSSRHEQEEFNKRLASLFTRYKIPFVQMNVTDLRKRVDMLEEAVNGKLPLPNLHGQLNISFTINPGLLNKCLYLRQVKITNENVYTSYDIFAPGHTNRMLDRYGQDLLVICFDNKVSPKTVSDILRPGILINGEDYNFLGCSSSGLKSRTCYMCRGTKQRIGKIRKECGDFTRIPTVSKRLKRIGMLFSEVRLTNFAVHDDLVLIIDDIESPDGEVFTDGCGQIGIELAKRVMECIYTVYSVFTHGDYLPSVYQIRYQGCKGVVAIKDSPDTSKRQLFVRKSMKKFDSGSKPFPEIGLCDHSKPYSYGHLNKQFIILLSGLGITDEIFLKKQKEHFECLEKMLEDPEIAIMVCCWKNRPELAARIARHSLGTAFANDRNIKNELSSLRSQILTKIETKPSQHIKIKLRILITESRNIFGVCDPVGILEYGQCFVRPTIRGKPRTITGKVTVGKNPCYLLGDIRVLKAIDDPRLHHLVDCIVFPVKGNRPHPSEIAGSDLDGDQYFVTWDADLVPPTLVRPYDYPSVESSNIAGNVDDYSMIDYFSRQNQTSGMMGRLDGYYMYWASKEGVKSDKCQQLGKLFSRSVDATKTGDSVRIPPYLIPVKDEFTQWQNEMGKRNDSHNVWERLECMALGESDKLKQVMVHEILDSEEKVVGLSEEFVWDILDHRAVGISDFEIFLVARQWCLAQGFTDKEASKKLLEFSECVNFAVFTTDEKLCAIDWGIPVNVVTNALNKSKLLTHSMTQHFSFTDSHSYWNQYISTSSCDFQWKHLLRGLQTHHESIVVFQLPDEMVFAIHFLVQLNHGKQEMPAGSVVTYFFSPCFNLYLKRVLSNGYSVNINEELMQVFQGNERNTFMWIKSEALSRGEVEYDRVSIDLTRFKRDILRANGHPRVNKLCYSHVECYVKCFNDEKEYFDLYTTDQKDDLNHVVTEEHEMAPIDEFPCEIIQHFVDHHDTVEKLKTEYSMEGAITSLKACALDGDCNSFQCIVQMMLSHGKPTIDATVTSHLISLLTVLATKYPPFPLYQELKESLQVILTSLHMLITKPTDCLCVMSRLCHLQCQELVSESIMSCIEPKSFQDFVACFKEWSLWTLLPLNVANTFADRVTAIYTPVQPRIESTNLQAFQEFVRIAENPSEHFLCERAIKEAYVAKFLHLLVQQLISEVNSTKNNKQTIVSRLKAYRHGDGGQKPSNNKNLTIGFRSTDTVASKGFKQGGYVSISLMSHATRKGVITGIGQIVQFTLHPTDIVVEVIEPVTTCIERSADLDKGHWNLQLLGNITSFKRASNALVKVLETKGNDLVPILTHPIGHSEYTPDTVTETYQDGTCSDSTPNEFNMSQQRAITASLNRRLTLIHGPPGTGKTRVACEIVRQVCERNERNDKSGIVLVCAETNTAVDNLARKLLHLGIRVVRIGGTEGQVASDIRPIVLEQQIELKRIELGKVKRNTKYLDSGLAKKILQSAQVIAVTCTGAGDTILNDFTFDFVVIDEATQATEPVSLVPISHNCHQLVLIGDPQQLAPTLPSSNITCDSLKTTLFHRLQKLLPSYFLELQYRMHPMLMEFPSKCFYKGKLKSAVEVIDRMLPPIASVPSLQTNPLLFIDSHFKEHRIGTSFANQKEADTIKYLVTLLLNSNIPPTNIAILTPYIGQVHTIRECLPKHFDVSTIDSFQGRERDVIIFSAVRCNDRKEIGFLDDQYRVNVLLTRAKSCLIGVGSRDTLASSILWTEWLKQVEIIAGDDLNCDEQKKVNRSQAKPYHRPKNQSYRQQKKH